MKEKLDLLVKNAEEKAKEIKTEADYLNINLVSIWLVLKICL